MKLTILHYTILVAASLIIFLLKNRKSASQSVQATTQSDAPPTRIAVANVDATPDAPMQFGYKCIWFAVKTSLSEDVAKEIGINSPVKCNWRSGIEAAYGKGVFVTPTVQGWTLVVGSELPTLDDQDRRKRTEALLVKLSQKFGEAHHYGTHRVVGFHAWARAVNGLIIREYAYLGERGEVLCDIGSRTDSERDAGVLAGPDHWPNEEDVMRVAEKWSLNPTTLDSQSAEKGVGLLGSL